MSPHLDITKNNPKTISPIVPFKNVIGTSYRDRLRKDPALFCPHGAALEKLDNVGDQSNGT